MSLLRFQDIYANLNSSTSRFILQQSAAWTSRSSRAATISYPKPIENSVLTMYPSIHFPLTSKPDSTLWRKSHKKVIQSLKCFLFIFLVWWCKYKHVLYISQVFSHKKVIQSLKCFLFIFLVWWCKYKHVLYISQVFVSFLLYYAVFVDISQFLRKKTLHFSPTQNSQNSFFEKKKGSKTTICHCTRIWHAPSGETITSTK